MQKHSRIPMYIPVALLSFLAAMLVPYGFILFGAVIVAFYIDALGNLIGLWGDR